MSSDTRVVGYLSGGARSATEEVDATIPFPHNEAVVWHGTIIAPLNRYMQVVVPVTLRLIPEGLEKGKDEHKSDDTGSSGGAECDGSVHHSTQAGS